MIDWFSDSWLLNPSIDSLLVRTFIETWFIDWLIDDWLIEKQRDR